MIYNETEYVPHDVMKDTVHEKVKSLLIQHGLCCCRECCSVVAKQALYDLPAMRATCVSEDIHMRFTMLEQQVQANILVAVLHAMKQTGVLDGICASGSRCRAVEDVTQ